MLNTLTLLRRRRVFVWAPICSTLPTARRCWRSTRMKTSASERPTRTSRSRRTIPVVARRSSVRSMLALWLSSSSNSDFLCKEGLTALLFFCKIIHRTAVFNSRGSRETISSYRTIPVSSHVPARPSPDQRGHSPDSDPRPGLPFRWPISWRGYSGSVRRGQRRNPRNSDRQTRQIHIRSALAYALHRPRSHAGLYRRVAGLRHEHHVICLRNAYVARRSWSGQRSCYGYCFRPSL